MQTVTRATKKPRASKTTQLRLLGAYRAVFAGNATKEDAEIVLADLAVFTGFYMVPGADVPTDQTKYADGRRSVYGRILGCLRMSANDVADLEEAARVEALSHPNHKVLNDNGR